MNQLQSKFLIYAIMRNLIYICGLLMLFFSCGFDATHIKGNGNVVTETRPVEEFHSIISKGSIDIEIMPSNSFGLEIQNDENLLEYMITEVVDGVLEVKYKKGNFADDHSKVFITVPTLEQINSSGSADIKFHGTLKNSKQIEIQLSGSGNVEGDVDAPLIKAKSSGSGNINLSGRTKTFICEIRGSGDVECSDLKSENADISAKGSADVKVFASVSLKIDITGSGHVYYSGNPPNPEINISGSGKVKKGE